MKFVLQFSSAIYRVLFVQRDPEIHNLINLEQMLAQEMHRNKPELLIFKCLYLYGNSNSSVFMLTNAYKSHAVNIRIKMGTKRKNKQQVANARESRRRR